MRIFGLHLNDTCCADEEAEQLIRRGADAATRLGPSTGSEDEAQRSAFNTLKLIRQLLIADRKHALLPMQHPHFSGKYCGVIRLCLIDTNVFMTQHDVVAMQSSEQCGFWI